MSEIEKRAHFFIERLGAQNAKFQAFLIKLFLKIEKQ
jgi:hypothetical protein